MSYFHFLWHSCAIRNCHQLLLYLCLRNTDSCNVEYLLNSDRIVAVKLSKVLLFGFYLSHCFRNMLPGQIRNSLWWSTVQSAVTAPFKKLLNVNNEIWSPVTFHIALGGGGGGVLYSQAKMHKNCIYSARICCCLNGFLAWIQRFDII